MPRMSDSESGSEPDYEVDIKENIQDALNLCFRHIASKFADSIITTTVDPGLIVEGAGLISLPLSPDTARSLIEICNQAPFGKGDSTIVDKQVRDTWELDASKVGFTNPLWADFLQKTTRNISSNLGVDLEVVQPKAELHKLLIYEKGSHFLPHVDTEKSPEMFATMVIVLPSHFEGAAVCLAHSSQQQILHSGGPDTASQTAVLAWYTDVTHEVKPVTFGYRFALAYNLLRSNTSKAPLPSPQDAVSIALRKALTLWVGAIENGYDAPSKLAWFLDHRYSHMNMNRSSLKGQDAYIVKCLRPLAQELRIKLGLASVSVKGVSSYPDEDGGYDDSKYGRGGRVDGIDVGDDFEITRREVGHLVDMDGNLVTEHPYFSDELEEEFMPEGWDHDVGEWHPDKQEYEGYLGNYAGNIKHYYRKTVLVIWPHDIDP
ncbi:hypothetical protein BDV93DRAFT_480289 [Ceratobasidium sp. AG-I]|nr:hypothetical protein BDV93DRAFT_480289 [Ceratobasidium sp. AG-I]